MTKTYRDGVQVQIRLAHTDWTYRNRRMEYCLEKKKEKTFALETPHPTLSVACSVNSRWRSRAKLVFLYQKDRRRGTSCCCAAARLQASPFRPTLSGRPPTWAQSAGMCPGPGPAALNHPDSDILSPSPSERPLWGGVRVVVVGGGGGVAGGDIYERSVHTHAHAAAIPLIYCRLDCGMEPYSSSPPHF